MDILGLIAVLSFGLTCFGIGYSIGKDSNKTQKQPPPDQRIRLFRNSLIGLTVQRQLLLGICQRRCPSLCLIYHNLQSAASIFQRLPDWFSLFFSLDLYTLNWFLHFRLQNSFPFLLATKAFLQCLRMRISLSLSVSMNEKHIRAMISSEWKSHTITGESFSSAIR